MKNVCMFVCLFVCLEKSMKCQDEFGDYNERIVLSQGYWKSYAIQTNEKCLFVCLFVWRCQSNAKMNMVIIMSV